MVDENYNPWLIEVNSSPACDYSTKVAERIVRSGLCDALKVVIEHRAWASSSSRRKGPPPDTGCWSKIHEGPVLTNPVASFGSDFEVKGSKLASAPLLKQVLHQFIESVICERAKRP